MINHRLRRAKSLPAGNYFDVEMSVKSELLSSLSGDTAHYKKVAISRSPEDESGFWIITDINPGRGMSSVTLSHHDVGLVRVYHRHYTPGPLDALVFGVDSDKATPKSTYRIWTGLAYGIPDEYPVDLSKWDDPDDWNDAKLKKTVTDQIGELPSTANLEVWSPDGEGFIDAVFLDEAVEDALKFASVINELLSAKKKRKNAPC